MKPGMQKIIQQVVDIGYEQLSCNDEGLTDSDDAIRIFSERNKDLTLSDSFVKKLEEACRKAFEDEFKFYRKAEYSYSMEKFKTQIRFFCHMCMTFHKEENGKFSHFYSAVVEGNQVHGTRACSTTWVLGKVDFFNERLRKIRR